MQCNICRNDTFGNQGARVNVRCTQCGSLERTRALKLHLDRLDIPQPGHRVLHFAPEIAVGTYLRGRAGGGYEPVDLFPHLFPGIAVAKFDLCKDAEALTPNSYDLIIHSHVAEHLPCNWSMVLLYLHRALKPGGHHIMCIPILGGFYEESLRELSPEEARLRFGQDDHVRRFGVGDLGRTLGMVFKGDLNRHQLSRNFSDDDLDEVNIPPNQRSSLNSSTIFVFGKSDARIDV